MITTKETMMLTPYDGRPVTDLPLEALMREVARVIEFGNTSARVRVALADELLRRAPTIREGSLRGNEELVNQVAKAIAQRAYEGLGVEWDEWNGTMKNGYLADARAALAAVDSYEPPAQR